MVHSERFVQLVEDAKNRIAEISPQDTLGKLGRMNEFLLVDIREDHEWEKGRIEGATHIGKGVIERDIEAACGDPEREIVLYCGGGYRSALAADALQKMGYRNVKSMAGGWREWNTLGYPVEVPE